MPWRCRLQEVQSWHSEREEKARMAGKAEATSDAAFRGYPAHRRTARRVSLLSSGGRLGRAGGTVTLLGTPPGQRREQSPHTQAVLPFGVMSSGP